MTGAFTHHGGRLAEACARYGGTAQQWLDLSTGINPNSWAPPSGVAVDWHRLPEPEERIFLETVAAHHFACDPGLCAAVPGSETALRLLGRLIDLPNLHRPPCYGTYAAAFGRAIALTDFRDLPTRATTLIVGNPNNPDGKTLSRADLTALLDHQQRQGGWLIVDEAFADCDPHGSVAGEVSQGRRLIVLRSFGKFFGLAGLRLGFVIAPCDLLAELRALLGDWPLHNAALKLGRAAYADRAWITRTRASLAASAGQLDALLARHGFRAQGDCPLFRLITSPDAPALFERMAQRRILTRPFAEWPQLLRIGLPADQEAFTQLEQALA